MQQRFLMAAEFPILFRLDRGDLLVASINWFRDVDMLHPLVRAMTECADLQDGHFAKLGWQRRGS